PPRPPPARRGPRRPRARLRPQQGPPPPPAQPRPGPPGGGFVAGEVARHFASHNLDMATQGRLLLAFTADLYRLPVSSLAAAADLRAFARLRLSRLRKRARSLAAAAATLEPTRLHALRIAFKLLRYGVEFFAPLFAARTINRYLDGVVHAQTALGFLQDVDIAHQRLSDW